MSVTGIALILSRGVCGMAPAQVVLPDESEVSLTRAGCVLLLTADP
jgi:hypothetical protein